LGTRIKGIKGIFADILLLVIASLPSINLPPKQSIPFPYKYSLRSYFFGTLIFYDSTDATDFFTMLCIVFKILRVLCDNLSVSSVLKIIKS